MTWTPCWTGVDIDDVVARIDMERLVEQTDLGAIIARSTGGLATPSTGYDASSGAVGLDRRIGRWVTRLLRRKEPGPAGTTRAAGPGGSTVSVRTHPSQWVSAQGQYAGSASPLRGVSDRPHRKHCPVFARAGDHLLRGADRDWLAGFLARNNIVVAIIYVAWQFLFFGFQWAADGSTWGMALLGVQVEYRAPTVRGWIPGEDGCAR